MSTTCLEGGDCVCLTGDQAVSGHKHFEKLLFADANYSSALPVGIHAANGIATRFITPTAAGQGIVLRGRRAGEDTAANVIVTGNEWRPGGYSFAVNSPLPCDVMTFGIADNGDIHYGWGTSPECSSDPAAGSLVDRSTASGHISLKREPGYYTAIRGALGARADAVQPNGEAPSPGPYTFSTPNGERYKYAGGHGDVDAGSAFPMRAGFIHEFYNPLSGTGARTDHRAYIDWNGAYVQNHGLTLAQFPSPEQVKVSTSLGEFYYEAAPGALYYAADTKHWYHAAGSHWAQLAEQDEVETLKAQVADLLARVAALEAE